MPVCLWGKSSSALCSYLQVPMCAVSSKYSLSYWRPVQPVLCTTACLHCVQTLLISRGNSASRRAITSTSRSNTNTVWSDTHQLKLSCPMRFPPFSEGYSHSFIPRCATGIDFRSTGICFFSPVYIRSSLTFSVITVTCTICFKYYFLFNYIVKHIWF